jgi:hypothetical protein
MSDKTTIDLNRKWCLPEKRFTHPDWEKISEWVEQSEIETEEDESAFYEKMATQWITAVTQELGTRYRSCESPHFVLVSLVSGEKANEVLDLLESSLTRIRASLPFLDESDPLGKCPVLAIADEELFYEYLSEFFGDDDDEQLFGAAGGVYLNTGYGHFAFPAKFELTEYQSVLSHELCHALLNHLELPTWLDEAIAVTVENSITGESSYFIDRDMIQQHRDYWTEERIQAFWSGESFWFADDGQLLSYHLAQFLLNGLYEGGVTPPTLMNQFIREASHEDAGVTAAKKVLDIDLTKFLTNLLGEGTWAPRLIEA